jgi:hypothetical protein
VGAVLPSDLSCVGQSDERLVHQGRRLQRVAAALAAHVPAREAAKLPLHERHQQFERSIVTVGPRPKQLGNGTR